jgi:tight adherence protein B
VAAGLRARDAVRRETTALSTQARLSAVVIASCPFVFAGLGLLGDRSIGHFLVGSPLGLVCLFGGIALDGAAFWWMRRIVAAVST